MRIGKLHIHRVNINELERNNSREGYWYYMRRFIHVYWGANDRDEKEVYSGHLEICGRKPGNLGGNWFATRFHVGNSGSETPFDGHLTLFGVSFYWGIGRGRRLADRITRCSGYKYDSRDWVLRVSDRTLYWEIANHSDMCDRFRMHSRSKERKVRNPRTPKWRRGSFNLSLADRIWGRKQYHYEDVDQHATLIKMEEGEYAVIIKLQRCYFGRTKVPRSKHLVSWSLDVDAPRGIPTHVDHSGGWKGDRSYGFGVRFANPRPQDWQFDAREAVTAWVLQERARTGFRVPDVQEEAS